MMSHYEDMRKGVAKMIETWEDWDEVFRMADRANDVFDYEEKSEDVEEVDLVNKPPHYSKDGGIECIDYMKENMGHVMFMGYLEGLVKKYGHRYRYKGKPLEDLRKQAWYLDRLIKEMEGDG